MRNHRLHIVNRHYAVQLGNARIHDYAATLTRELREESVSA
jgi:hypothetical protein